MQLDNLIKGGFIDPEELLNEDSFDDQLFKEVVDSTVNELTGSPKRKDGSDDAPTGLLKLRALPVPPNRRAAKNGKG